MKKRVGAEANDTTGCKQAEEALRENEERYRAIFEQAADSIVLVDTETGALVEFNDRAHENLNYTREEFQKVKIHDFEVIESAYEVAKHIKKILKQGADTFETKHRTKDGEIRDIQVSSRAVFIRGRSFVQSIWRDITERNRVEEELAKYHQHLKVLVEERTIELRNANEQLQREVIERKRAEEALLRHEAYFRSLIENSMDAIVVLAANGSVKATPCPRRILGNEPEEQIGRAWWEYVRPEDMEDLAKDFVWMIETPGATAHKELSVQHRNGSWIHIEVAVQNLLSDPVVAGIVITYHDITKRKEAEEKLQELYHRETLLRQRLEEEMRKRIEFTRALAHELKTPLTPVVMSSELLISELKDETLLRVAQNIYRGASNLNSRIDELLDLARGEMGMLQLKPEQVDILQLLREVVEDVALMPLSRGQSLTSKLPPSLPLVWCDKIRLQQIVLNLLNNAFKFTPDGGKISLRARQEDGNLVVEVEDTGAGITEEEQQRLFEPYHRVDTDREHLSGLGLGLALCKTLVELHGGRIWVGSRKGKGSTFSFSLPLGVPSQ